MLPLSPSQIRKMFGDAVKLMAAGDLDKAEQALSALVASAPATAEAHFQLGRIALVRNAPQDAIGHFDRAAALRPKEAAIWQHLAQAVAALDDAAQARDFLKKAKAAQVDAQLYARLQAQVAPQKTRPKRGTGSASPDQIRALIGLMNKGAFAEAEQRAAEMHARHPRVAIIADILANAQARLGKPAAAEASFKTALRLDPKFAEAHNNFGRFLVEQGRIGEGITQIRAGLKIAPKLAQGWLNLGTALARQGAGDLALDALAKAVAADPGLLEARVQLGVQQIGARRFDEAAATLKEAIGRGDARPGTQMHLGRALSAGGRTEEALEVYDRAIAASPGAVQTKGAKALLLQTLGRFDEAEALFREMIAQDPDNGEHYRVFIASHKVTPDDPLIAQMEAQFAKATLSDESRMNLGFALAKAMEDTKQYDKVFTYLRSANALMRKRFPYDIEARRSEVAALRTAFKDVDFTARQVGETSDFAPIFVTGMPRSGTTLVEQILASHARVTGCGEVGFVADEAARAMAAEGGGYRPLASLGDTEIAALGQRIEAYFRSHYPQADLVTDKSIQTYLMTGLVHLALPKAKIVVVRRDPRDTLLSIYKNIFPDGTHRYAYDLRDLGLYYRLFEGMLAFWREKLPGGFHEIQYEDLIADPEQEARKLIAACGLEWDDACLSFHENKRQVSTLSVFQVRQPIYKSSMKAWQRYEGEIGEMIEALGDAI